MRTVWLISLWLMMALPVVAQDSDDEIMVTDGVKHSVPLEAIIFDDFDSRGDRALPYTLATQADIDRLRDRIRPFCHGELAACFTPEYESVDETDEWLSGGALLVGYVDADGQAYAYPFGILSFHEIVNDTLADEPVLISYCPLCHSAVVYSRLHDGEELVFGNTSALYENDLVMYDIGTESYWFQVGGRAILGEMTGSQLTLLPSIVTTWDEWKQQHPETVVLQRPVDYVDYGQDAAGRLSALVTAGQFFFPISEEIVADERLDRGESVLIVQIDDEAVAYPLRELGDAATTDTVGGQEIVVLSLERGPTGAAYLTELENGTQVELEFADGAWVDAVSGSAFDLSGTAIDGELEGMQLTPVPARYSFWFAAVASTPGIEPYSD